MRSCPHCSVAVDEEATVCPDCYGSIPEQAGATESGEHRRPSRGGDGSRDPPDGDQPGGGRSHAEEDRQHPTREQGRAGSALHEDIGRHPARDVSREPSRRGDKRTVRDERGRRDERPPGEEHPTADHQGGTDRRSLLKAGVAVVVAAGGGYVVYDALIGPGSPAGTARSFVEALDAGDVERANALVHDDAPMGELDSSSINSMSSTRNSIDSTEVVEQSEDGAVVAVELSRGPSDVARAVDVQVVLRRQDGGWRVWRYS